MSKTIFKILKYSISIILFVILVYIINKMEVFKGASPTNIKQYLNSFGILAPVIFIVIFTVVPLTLFPDSILAISGGLAFGLVKGSVYTMIGALLGGTLSFYISRSLGRNFVTKIMGKHITNFEKGIEKRGFVIILMLRLVPLFPFDIVSYSAGLSKIKYKDFIFATLIGTIPGILVYVNIGDKSNCIGSGKFFISIALLLLLVLLSIILKKKISFNKLQDS